MHQQRGILKAIYVTEDAVTYATVDVDQIGVLANLESLVNSSIDASKMIASMVLCWTLFMHAGAFGEAKNSPALAFVVCAQCPIPV